MAGGNRGDDDREWTREPPDRTERGTAADPVGSGAERQRYRAAPIATGRPDAVGHESAASPNEGGTAEGTTFRPGTNGRFLILEAGRDEHRRSDQPGAHQAPRRQRRHDPPARHPPGRPGDADRCLPAPRRRRPRVPPRVGRGRRAARALLLPRRRPAAAAGGPRRPGPDPDPPGDGADLRPGPAGRDRRGRRSAGRHPGVRPASPGPADRRYAAVHRRGGRGAGLRRGLELRAVRAAPGP